MATKWIDKKEAIRALRRLIEQLQASDSESFNRDGLRAFVSDQFDVEMSNVEVLALAFENSQDSDQSKVETRAA